MATFINTRQESPLASVEFAPQSEGNFTFFHVKNGADLSKVKDLITSEPFGQQLIAESAAGNNETVLVTRGDRSKEAIIKALSANGEKLVAPPEVKRFEPWKLRGTLSFIGQPLQLASSFMAKKVDIATATFAVSNLIANGINLAFGAGKSKDSHQLHYLKQQVNALVAPAVAEPGALPSITDDTRAELRKEPAKRKSIGQKAHDFMRDNSVVVGEILFRYFGAFALVFPFQQRDAKTGMVGGWKAAIGEIKEMNFKGALEKGVNNDKFTRYAGILYLVGKSLALFSKVPDPFNPKKHTEIDKVREKYVFKASSVIESGAAGLITYDRFANRKITVGGKQMPDFVGGTGGGIFAVAQGIRFFAPFGMREVDMDELYAHTTDALAQAAPEKLPQLLAETTSLLQQHFSAKHLEYSKIYSKLSNDLYRYHNIALDGVQPTLGMENVIQEADRANASALPKGDEGTVRAADASKVDTAAPADRSYSHAAHIPGRGSHQEKVAATRGAGAMAGI